MSKQKILALVAVLGLAGSGTAMADGHWRARPSYPSQPRVQVGLNIVLGGYGYAPGVPVPMTPVVRQWAMQPAVVWAPGYQAVYGPAYGPGYRGGYRGNDRGDYRDHGWRDHRRHRHGYDGDRCDD